MAIAVSDLVTEFRRTHKDATSAMAYKYATRIDRRVVRVFKFRQKWIAAALIAYEEELALSESAVWVRECRYCSLPNPEPNKGKPGSRLEFTTEDGLDTGTDDFRQRTPAGSADRKVWQSHSDVSGTLGLTPAPNESTLSVTGATNATPIVVTSSAAHGLADGDRVDIYDVVGNTNANGEWYAKVTGYSTTTFALYEEEALTTAVAGNAGYTSGGLVLCDGSPLLLLKVNWSTTLTSADSLPASPILEDLYLNGMKWLHAEARHAKDRDKFKEWFENALVDQDQIINRRGGHVNRTLATVKDRGNYCVPQSRF